MMTKVMIDSPETLTMGMVRDLVLHLLPPTLHEDLLLKIDGCRSPIAGLKYLDSYINVVFLDGSTAREEID